MIFASVLLINLARLLVSADSSTEAINYVCVELERAYPDKLHYPGDAAYEKEQLRYWSIYNTNTRPACTFQPTLAEEVSVAVKLIAKETVPFAIKSGGHNHNSFSAIKDGVLIALGNMNTVQNLGNGSAIVGPGNRWIDVYSKLQEDGLVVVGGRMSDVGVGGLLLGGGLSFLSFEHGLAADNVLEYEVVLADGNIVRASQYSRSDLFYALKGGCNQFGIVTEFKLKTYSIDLVWGGIVTYSIELQEDLFKAFENLRLARNSKVSLTPYLVRTTNSSVFTAIIFYNGPDPGNVFDEFLSIKSIARDLRTRTYPEYVENFSVGSEINNYGWILRSESTGASLDLYETTFNLWKNLTDPLVHESSTQWSLAYQLIPKSVSQGPKADAYALLDEDLIWLIISSGYGNSNDRQDEIEAGRQLGYKIEEAEADSKSKTRYRPLFLNDAWEDQQVFQSWSSYKDLKKTKEKYDPLNIWGRTGGFKL
ncbi:putative FAD-linked oxidoreductase [Neolecta irregularis DAH-3]|uniref:Putative FAD-linked oxidoreductase n=1 Tax=Neolecta irregularis (strain DAH-3) TaxID=1198029 RepID=A0A1U7LRA3_NEOID|nr:putative FAD-linked oxidoreductase [Neolecta irregularis DAH-3]|eukprot:OLL25174.1 putative FAD-linked oxidoreductase [Neolecta irregularis DAH-3]